MKHDPFERDSGPCGALHFNYFPPRRGKAARCQRPESQRWEPSELITVILLLLFLFLQMLKPGAGGGLFPLESAQPPGSQRPPREGISCENKRGRFGGSGGVGGGCGRGG